MFFDFISNNPSALAVITLALTIAGGLALGHVRVWGVGLGISGVLFSGLVFGNFGLTLDPAILNFVRDFGLILFIFAVGLQVGPGFADSLKRRGLILNAIASGVVVLAVLLTVLFIWLFGQPPAALIGVFSGATSSTPALAAAAQSLEELAPATLSQDVSMLGLGCALAYPFSVVGVIIAMILTRLVGRIDIRQEMRLMEEQARLLHPPLEMRNMRVTNQNLFGKTLDSIPGLEDMGVTISRVMEDGKVFAATPGTELKPDMIIHAVGERGQLDRASLIIGPEVETRLEAAHGELEVRYLLVTNSAAIGKTLQALHLSPDQGITVTRIRRAGMELAPRRYLSLHFGDKVVCVGHRDHLDRAESILGNSSKAFDQPHVLPLFVGVALGVLVGSLPLAIPGLSSGFKLGLAGGPLLVAILLSRVQHFAGMTWYLPSSASALLREVGISLFLACVGLAAGNGFFEAVFSDTGLLWLGLGAAVTLVPLLVASFVARVIFRFNYATLCGLLVGSMTSAPTLSFAVDMLDSDIPASVYATVYPMATILRLLSAQGLVMVFFA